MTPAYCQTCGSDGRCKHRRASRVTALLEMFGFSQTSGQPAPPPETDATVVAGAERTGVLTTTEPVLPSRSTTVLVQELWAADDADAAPFPPPVAPTIAPTTRLGSTLRVLLGVVVLAAAGFGSYLGVEWWLSQRHDTIVAEAVDVLAVARTNAAELPAVVAALTDADSDPVALTEASIAIVALDGDTLALLGLADPPDQPLGALLSVDDPLGTQRPGYRALADQAGHLSGNLTPLLTARLSLERLPVLPELPAGADPITIEETTTSLAQVITDLEGIAELLREPLVGPLQTALDQLGTVTPRYVAALRTANPIAEDEADRLGEIMETLRTDLSDTVAAEAQGVSGDVSRYVASISAAG